MFIAMNRFKIKLGKEEQFENIWKNRDSHLNKVEGFIEFKLLRSEPNDMFTLYASHSVWKSSKDFENWKKSESFRLAHNNAGSTKDIYLGHPEFEGFEVRV